MKLFEYKTQRSGLLLSIFGLIMVFFGLYMGDTRGPLRIDIQDAVFHLDSVGGFSYYVGLLILFIGLACVFNIVTVLSNWIKSGK